MENHPGWWLVTLGVGGIAFLASSVILGNKDAKTALNTRLHRTVQACYLVVCFGCSRGLIVVADRLTATFPSYFPLFYLSLLAVTVGVIVLLDRPIGPGYKPTVATVALWIFFAVVVAFLIELGHLHDPVDRAMGSYPWIISGSILACAFIWVALRYLLYRERRQEEARMMLLVTGILCWGVLLFCLHGRLN